MRLDNKRIFWLRRLANRGRSIMSSQRWYHFPKGTRTDIIRLKKPIDVARIIPEGNPRAGLSPVRLEVFLCRRNCHIYRYKSLDVTPTWCDVFSSILRQLGAWYNISLFTTRRAALTPMISLIYRQWRGPDSIYKRVPSTLRPIVDCYLDIMSDVYLYNFFNCQPVSQENITWVGFSVWFFLLVADTESITKFRSFPMSFG